MRNKIKTIVKFILIFYIIQVTVNKERKVGKYVQLET